MYLAGLAMDLCNADGIYVDIVELGDVDLSNITGGKLNIFIHYCDFNTFTSRSLMEFHLFPIC